MTQPEQDAPRCDTCGAEITTGLMAALCPRRERCEFWPHEADPETIQFMDWIGGRAASPDLPPAAVPEDEHDFDDDAVCRRCGFDGAEWHWWKHSTYEGRAQPEARQPRCKDRQRGE